MPKAKIKQSKNMRKIHEKAKIGDEVEIGKYTIVHKNAKIKKGTKVGNHCVIGEPTELAQRKEVTIGENSLIRSHSVIYQGSIFGPELTTGHSVLVRENTKAGENLQVGSQSEIQGDCEFGNYVRMHSDVHVSKGASIGDLVWLFPRVQFTNDPLPPSTIREEVKIGAMAVISTGTLLLPGVSVGMGSVVAAGSIVRKSIPKVRCAKGDPAEVFCRLDQLASLKHNVSYPWTENYRDEYPEEAQDIIDSISSKIYRELERIKSKK